MHIKQLRNNKGYSLQFCDMEEANALLEFIETYPDSSGDMKHLAYKMKSALSDKYANDVTKISMPLWFEDGSLLISALWIAYAYWDESDFGYRAQKAIEHDDKLYAERLQEAKDHQLETVNESLVNGEDELQLSDDDRKGLSDSNANNN